MVALVADGCTNEEIGRHLFLAASTVKKHACKIKRKLGARSRAQMVTIAFQRGYLKIPALESEVSG